MRTFLVTLVALVCVAILGFAACDDEPDGDGDADTDTDTDTDTDADADTGPTWSTEVVAGDNVGRYSSIDVDSSNNVGLAYYGFDWREGELCEVLGEPPMENRYPIFYAQLPAGTDTWLTEMVTEPIHIDMPQGVSFRFTPAGVPTMAVFTGEELDVLCSSNDLELLTRGGGGSWANQVVVTDSGSAPPNTIGDCNASASTAGYTVGSWPALAYDSAGTAAIVYRDTHFGGMQRDDIQRADAEVAIGSGGFRFLMVDCGNGGGRDSAAIFDSSDRLVVAHRITTESHMDDLHGLWAQLLQPDDTWLTIRLATGRVGFQQSSMVAGPDGMVAVVYYDYTLRHPYVAILEDPERFADGGSWRQEDVGDNRFDEGYYPSIAIAPDGTLAVAYHRCNRTGSSGDACDDDVDGLIYAHRTGPDTWSRREVDMGTRGECGTHTSLAFASDGTAYVSYVCVRNPSGSDFIAELKVATRRP